MIYIVLLNGSALLIRSLIFIKNSIYYYFSQVEFLSISEFISSYLTKSFSFYVR